MKKKFTVRLDDRQAAFVERKQREMKRARELIGVRDRVTLQAIFQALVDNWMEMDDPRKIAEKKQHK